MQLMAICPRCRGLLVPDEANSTVRICAPCAGRFVGPTTPPEVLAPEITALNENWLSCPACLLPMTPVATHPEQEHHCPACEGRWYEPSTEVAEPEPNSTALVLAEIPEEQVSPFIKNMCYTLSLPERALRTFVGIAAGTTSNVAGLLVPQAFQSSKSYEVAVKNSLEFLTTTIGGFQDESGKQPTGADAAGAHIARKTVGNFVDLASLALLHVSPMWVFAVVSDVAYGSSTYLKELADDLKAQGIIDETSTINGVDDVLRAIQKASGDACSTLDRPPFSVEELQLVVQQTRDSLKDADLRKVLPEREVRNYWNSLREVANQENVTMLNAATAIAMRTVEQTDTMRKSAVSGVRVAGNLFQRSVLDHYQSALKEVREKGFLAVISATYQPYVARVWDNFQGDRPSWTESLLDPSRINKLLSWRPSFFKNS